MPCFIISSPERVMPWTSQCTAIPAAGMAPRRSATRRRRALPLAFPVPLAGTGAPRREQRPGRPRLHPPQALDGLREAPCLCYGTLRLGLVVVVVFRGSHVAAKIHQLLPGLYVLRAGPALKGGYEPVPRFRLDRQHWRRQHCEPSRRRVLICVAWRPVVGVPEQTWHTGSTVPVHQMGVYESNMTDTTQSSEKCLQVLNTLGERLASCGLRGGTAVQRPRPRRSGSRWIGAAGVGMSALRLHAARRPPPAPDPPSMPRADPTSARPCSPTRPYSLQPPASGGIGRE